MEKSTELTELNEYCLLEIFSYLNTCDLRRLRATCRYFKNLIKTGSTFNFDLDVDQTDETYTTAIAIIRRKKRKQAESVIMSNSKFEREFVPIMARTMEQLELMSAASKVVYWMLLNFSNMTHLTLINIRLRYNFSNCTPFLERLKSLALINCKPSDIFTPLRDTRDIKLDLLIPYKVLQDAKGLKCLNLTKNRIRGFDLHGVVGLHCLNISMSVYVLTHEFLKSNGKTLNFLNIEQSNHKNAESLSQLSLVMVALITLKVSSCALLDISVVEGLTKFGNLTSIHIELNGEGMVNELLLYFSQNGNLKSLNLSKGPYKHIVDYNIISRISTLEELNLDDHYTLRDDHIKLFSLTLNLERLHLNGVNFSDKCILDFVCENPQLLLLNVYYTRQNIEPKILEIAERQLKNNTRQIPIRLLYGKRVKGIKYWKKPNGNYRQCKLGPLAFVPGALAYKPCNHNK